MRLPRLLQHLQPRTSKFLGCLCQAGFAGLLKSPLRRAFSWDTHKTRLSHPPWGRILLLFRSQNGPHVRRLKNEFLFFRWPKRLQLATRFFVQLSICISLSDVLCQTCSERRSFAAVSGV
jgi:hypothetical protein